MKLFFLRFITTFTQVAFIVMVFISKTFYRVINKRKVDEVSEDLNGNNFIKIS